MCVKHTYEPEIVCATEISFEIDNGILRNLQFADGCHGNGQALGKLCEGRRVDEIIRLLKGIECEDKGTSCADQLTKALEKALLQP